jgi:SHS2 domain-containing protein
MTYRFLDDIAVADVAFTVTACDLEGLFADAAEALLAVMSEDPATIRPLEAVSLHLESPTLVLLLFTFLNELVFYKDARRLFLRPSNLSIQGCSPCSLSATLVGEEIDTARHRPMTDVKAATLHRLSVVAGKGRWEATVVLDV